MKDQIQKAFEEEYRDDIKPYQYHKGDKSYYGPDIDIHQKYKAFKAGFQADRWIKIEEGCEMPKHEEDVDIIVEGFRVVDCLYTEYEDEKPGFYDERKDIIHRLENVEYWQPIILPKE